jgi:hypothetical protein
MYVRMYVCMHVCMYMYMRTLDEAPASFSILALSIDALQVCVYVCMFMCLCYMSTKVV